MCRARRSVRVTGSSGRPSTMNQLFRNLDFELSVARYQDLPPASGREIAFVGRSNAGKSSAINTLADHVRLAFVSKTPGRTQLINFFRLSGDAYLVDLPGYGYADVPEAVRAGWRELLERYLTERHSLIGLVVVMDARRPLTNLDRQLLAWFAPTGKPTHLLLTKADKLARGAAAAMLAATRAEIARQGYRCTAQLFSSLKKTGREECEATLLGWLAEQKETPGTRGAHRG